MTKDEAWSVLYEEVVKHWHLRMDGSDNDAVDKALAALKAYAAAEALADPLALLEAALGEEDGYVVKGWQTKDGELTIQRINGELRYLWEYPDRIGVVTGEEAAALLKGDEG